MAAIEVLVVGDEGQLRTAVVQTIARALFAVCEVRVADEDGRFSDDIPAGVLTGVIVSLEQTEPPDFW